MQTDIHLADELWLSILPHLSADDQQEAASKLLEVLKGRGHDVSESDLSSFVKQIGVKITIEKDF